MSPLSGLTFQITSQVKLYHLKELCDLNNDYGQSLPPRSLMNDHFKIIIWDLYWLKELCPGRPQQWPYKVSSPNITTGWPAILRTPPEYNSTNSKSSVFGDLNNLQFFPLCHHQVACHFKTPKHTSTYSKEFCPRYQTSTLLLYYTYKIHITVGISQSKKK